MSEQAEKITQFTAITGVSEDRAKFYLDSATWQVDIALASYYENDGENDAEIIEPIPVHGLDTVNVTPPVSGESAPSAGKTKSSKSKSSTNRGKVATLNTLNLSSDDDEEEGQAFYAGGSEHSGQQVLGPPKKKDIVADMFKSVQEHGVEVVDERPGSSNRAFKGTGYKLGETSTDSTVIPGAAEPSAPNEISLKLWKDGFSVNDGDLRMYSDPDNRDFLDSVRRGEIPQELRGGGSEVHLAMEDHRMENFQLSQKKAKPFSGAGYTLGNPAPPIVGACRNEDKPVNEQVAKQNLNTDTSQPVTNIQIRLADGSRLVGQFNHEHTIGEIRSFILIARPQYATQTFNLISPYPSKVLDDSQTIRDAGILNAAIMQKMV